MELFRSLIAAFFSVLIFCSLTNADPSSEFARIRQANLSTCLSGRFPSLCNRKLLTKEEAARVNEAERRQNLQTCLQGRFSSLCKHDLLSTEERLRVNEAEKRHNLETCLSGRFKSLCKYNLLEPQQLAQVKQAEARASTELQKLTESPEFQARLRSRLTGGGGCETGHWIASISDDGDIIKLEDGSVWEVDSIDTIDSTLWLPYSDIVACDDKLVNTDDGETVGARRLR